MCSLPAGRRYSWQGQVLHLPLAIPALSNIVVVLQKLNEQHKLFSGVRSLRSLLTAKKHIIAIFNPVNALSITYYTKHATGHY